jgi:hypothetical protein
MTATVPTTEPADFVAGDTLTWSRSLSDYPAGTWTLKYRLINAAGKVDITASASGTDHLVSVASATTAAYTAGVYAWLAWVEKTGERHTVGNGTITIKPNIAALNTLDARSNAKKILDQLMAAYTTYTASNGHVAEYEIGDRRMKYRSAADIIEQIDRWKAIVAAETRAERIAAGLGAGNSIKVRF